jgi:uncharacterized protein YqjF (DUF2071 family)
MKTLNTDPKPHRNARPLLIADWDSVVMLHLEVPKAKLQETIPFTLDTFEDRAFVTLVAFTIRRMRPVFGGGLTGFLFRPISTHAFLNVRTYVRHHDEIGIHFLAEWLPNRISVQLGPGTFCLPYHHGRHQYDHRPESGRFSGEVRDVTNNRSLTYEGRYRDEGPAFITQRGTLDGFLCERYVAFNAIKRRRRKFHVWHNPWRMRRLKADLKECSLLTDRWPWLAEAPITLAHFSEGLKDVGMSRPLRLKPGF